MTRSIFLAFVTIFLVNSSFGQEKIASMILKKDFPDLPDREGVVLTVTFPPGSSSPKHRHNAHTFVYVLEGSLIMQVEGGEPVTLQPGETFYENPDDIHVLSKNASDSEPATILVFFVKKEGVPISTPVP